MDFLRVGVIGVGSMGMNHARVYADLDRVQLVAVADSNAEAVQKVARKCNAKAYTDFTQLLDDEAIDAVSIAVPTSMHKQVAMAALQKGKHVLLEKPIALTEEEAQEIIDCSKKNKVKLMIGHIERFNPAIRELKQRLHRGDLGQIYKIDVQRIGPFPIRITDVGVITDLSVHDLDILSYLFGQEPVRMYAETQQRLHPHHEDSVTALISYRNNALAVLNINYLSPTKTRQLKVFGKKGMFEVNYLTQELYFYENKAFSSDDWQSVSEGDMTLINLPKKEPLQTEIEEFIQCITQNSEPPVSGEQGLQILKLANLLSESAQSKKIIHL